MALTIPTILNSKRLLKSSRGETLKIIERARASEQFFLASNGGDALVPIGIIQGMSIVGMSTPSDGDSGFRFIMPRDIRITKMVVECGETVSNLNGDFVIRLNKNGDYTGMEVTVPAGGSGVFVDEQHEFQASEGDYLVYNLDLTDPTSGAIQDLKISLIGE